MPPGCRAREPVARYFYYQHKKTLVPPWKRPQARPRDRNHHFTSRPYGHPGSAARTRRPRTLHGAAGCGAPARRLLHRQRRPAHHRRGPLRGRGGPGTGRRRIRGGVRRPAGPRRPARRPARPAPPVPGRHGGLRADLAGLRPGAGRLVAGGRAGGAGRLGRRDAAAGAGDHPGDHDRSPAREGHEPVRGDGRPVDGGRADPGRCPGGSGHRGHRLAFRLPRQRPGRPRGPLPRRPRGPGDPLRAPRAGGRPRHLPAGRLDPDPPGATDRGPGGGLAAVDVAVAGGVPVRGGGVLRGGAPGGPRGPYPAGPAEPVRDRLAAPRPAADRAVLDRLQRLHVRHRGGVAAGRGPGPGGRGPGPGTAGGGVLPLLPRRPPTGRPLRHPRGAHRRRPPGSGPGPDDAGRVAFLARPRPGRTPAGRGGRGRGPGTSAPGRPPVGPLGGARRTRRRGQWRHGHHPAVVTGPGRGHPGHPVPVADPGDGHAGRPGDDAAGPVGRGGADGPAEPAPPRTIA